MYTWKFMEKKRILFVCLGNICRSPMAEGLFVHLVNEQGKDEDYVIDSAGTAGYHIGARPDHRMIETAESHGVGLPSNARQFVSDDFNRFDYIIAMDEENVDNIEAIKPDTSHAKLFKMRDFDVEGKGENVPDPYYGGLSGFEDVYNMLKRCNVELLEYLENDK
jgi:protein-tyrosine phosphatase